jgi:sec-independent protein translocase protein TatA
MISTFLVWNINFFNIMINTVLAFVGGLGGWEIILIMFVILVFFGAKRIPELARGLGKGIREFKDATNEIKKDIESGIKEDIPKV